MNDIKPRIFASKCLGFAACRWNGLSMPDKFVDELDPFVSYVNTCPEVEIGLGVPRDPIRIVLRDREYKLMQLDTGRDVTDDMKGFASNFLDGIGEVDGFILKDRSPSCGLKDVKVYPGLEPSGTIGKTDGFFGAEVKSRFPFLAVETEGRLKNRPLRENFLTKIFASAKFRQIRKALRMKALVEFHAENKLLLMAYNQSELKVLGRIVANHEKKDVSTVFNEYERHFFRALSGVARYTANINVMMHAMGYFSKALSKEEKKFFLNTLEEYRREQVPLSVPLKLLKSYIVRFDEGYLAEQTFFDPYPEKLMHIQNSGKGRKF
ncbi:MAG: DUF1722 domain-containing protein [Candidatus Omnitrophica bacterium]|nr:DUF1722 domain-containing protein [Candidatus Omnitrophota bacterium]